MRKTRLPVLRTFDGPPADRDRATLITMGRVVHRINAATGELLKPHNLSLPHLEVLLTLSGGEGISQQELSERLLMTKGNICVTLQKMEAAGLVERRSDPTDQRFHRLYLTEAARLLLARLRPSHRELIRSGFSPLSEAEQATLLELLLRVDTRLDSVTADS